MPDQLEPIVRKSCPRTCFGTVLQCCLYMVLSLVAGASDARDVINVPADGSINALQIIKECEVCPELVVVPLGSFMMGAKPEDSWNRFDFYGENATGRIRGPDELNIIPDEHPRHRVIIDIPYALGRNEVTYGEWMACVADGGCKHSPEHIVIDFNGPVPLGPNHPVINVSYNDILEYIAWINTQTGVDAYRLPTEAEWEYAAKAGSETRFAQGQELDADQANFSRDATEHVRGRASSFPHLTNKRMPVAVGELNAANKWGLRHMSGNVNEITLSCSSPKHLGLSTSSAYLTNAQSQQSCRRIAKGGGYSSAMDGLRLAARKHPTEERRRPFFGFRILREMK